MSTTRNEPSKYGPDEGHSIVKWSSSQNWVVFIRAIFRRLISHRGYHILLCALDAWCPMCWMTHMPNITLIHLILTINGGDSIPKWCASAILDEGHCSGPHQSTQCANTMSWWVPLNQENRGASQYKDVISILRCRLTSIEIPIMKKRPPDGHGDSHLLSTVWFLLEASFGLRVLLILASVCMSVHVCSNHKLVCTITRHPLKLGSPNLGQGCERTWLRFLLFYGAIDLDLQGQI